MQSMQKPAIALRLLFSTLTLFAIATQFSIQVGQGFSVVNFVSYFTNLSNLFAAIIFAMSAVRLIRNETPSPPMDLARGISVINMAVVGIVFSLLLRNVDLGSLLPWVNFLLHYFMPVVVVLDWLILPPSTRFAFKQILLCQLFPLLYLAYVLMRGASVNWYPYPFLNPSNVGGYGGVALYAAGITGVFLLSAWLLLTLGNRLGARAALKRP
jgi:hypothetical protein